MMQRIDTYTVKLSASGKDAFTLRCAQPDLEALLRICAFNGIDSLEVTKDRDVSEAMKAPTWTPNPTIGPAPWDIKLNTID